MRFVPFIACFVVGLVIGIILTYRRGDRRSSTSVSDWQRKYRDLERRHRDLTRRFETADPKTDPKASIYRSLLYDAAHFLEHPEVLTPPERDATLRAIKTALDGSNERS